MKNFLAVDLGASNGRLLLGRWDGTRFHLNEVHRFCNGPVTVMGHKHWDTLRLWEEIKTGLSRYSAEYKEVPAAIGVDTWGVDFGLLDGAGRLLGNPYHYRDSQTDGMMETLFQTVPADQVFAETGIQFMQFNSVFQLYAMVRRCDPQLAAARRLLFMPDLFHYWLTGVQSAEYTIATTSQMLGARERQWASGMLGRLGIPTEILPEIVRPGTVLGALLRDVVQECGHGRLPAGCRDRQSRYRERGCRHPGARRKECLHQQRNVEPDGHGGEGTGHQRADPSDERDQ